MVYENWIILAVHAESLYLIGWIRCFLAMVRMYVMRRMFVRLMSDINRIYPKRYAYMSAGRSDQRELQHISAVSIIDAYGGVMLFVPQSSTCLSLPRRRDSTIETN